ncbi:RagB/SusD family nutrient uptake outer membrane protein [Pedobacter sp. MC2016-24]|uniref:RagB/SusD family nutrient uptake outer membrane protein n=1 Tax=Pedobacter sp. MC2016-24 TaxID=2780090 RepID=UPI0018822932|nr:RagB/SusD family nutrient uptake outer membrane protein [Pedobacter sp. MC2016-24]MBE9598601.1 RagB/SusD family nutrient uptake outer membrane protein [Pedobacter sp. MC2016-24]
MKRIYYIVIAMLALHLGACKKFLDVKPKTQVESDVAFKDESGYQNALTGVYVKLTAKSLYGKELTFGMIDVLGRQYSQITGFYTNFNTYNYALDSVKTRTVAVWKDMYNGIANANNLIENLDRTDLPAFTGPNYNVIKGEALGLRAFMHFDLLRLYAPAPASAGGMDALAIPYVTKFVTQNTPRTSVKDVIGKVIADLNAAEALLKTSDPIVPGNTVTNNYLRDRSYKFNYYAVKALQARVYLYAGDLVNALKCAEEVINSKVFPFAAVANITTGQDRVYNSELIFSLNINDLHTYTASYFGTETNRLAKLSAEYAADFDGIGSDYRFLYLSENPGGVYRYSTKYTPVANSFINFMYKMPVIRVSEMYYIASECLIGVDKTRAVAYLNAVRRARNQTADVAVTTSNQELQNQIYREYRREFIAEGQLFYYYKRVNSPTIAYTAVVGSNAIYVLPLPEDELKYGN